MADGVPVTCIVLALDEERNLDHVLGSLRRADQVLVVDSGSIDGTQEIARQHGVTLIEHQWEGYARQRNWAMALPQVANEWVLFVDADEMVPEEAWDEIAMFISHPGSARGADFRRQVVLFGRVLKHGGFSTARVTRLLHRRHCHFQEREVHEHAVVDGGIAHLAVPLLHHDRKPFEAWLSRHNRYSTLEARARLSPPPPTPASVGAARKAKQWVRTVVWPWLPARPLLMFLYVYIVRLGFLDGRAGLRVSALYGFQELSVQIKLEELRDEAGPC